MDIELKLKPPFRAEHIGSLLRPQSLRERYERGKRLPDESDDEAVREVVALQQEVGLNVITDGEMRRVRFMEGVFENLEGMEHIAEDPISNFKGYLNFIRLVKSMGVAHLPTIYCSGKIKRVKPIFVDDFKFTSSLISPESVGSIKVTMCSPNWFHQFHGSERTYDLTVYKNDDEYFADLAVAYKAEFKDLYDLGCRHIQLDDPSLANFCDNISVEAMKSSGVDPHELMDTYIRAINLCTEGRPHDLIISIHICRGNWKGRHFSAGGYEPIAEVFRRLDVDAFFLEFDDERSGDFSPLRHVPNNKAVVLGLVTTKHAQFESLDDLKARVHEASREMARSGSRTQDEALNQLCISTQCGFASTWEGNPEMTEEVQKQKLRLVVNAAKDIWPE